MPERSSYDAAIRLLNESAITAKQMNDPEWQENIYMQLYSAYQLKGDYKTALFYSNTARHLKDTLELWGDGVCKVFRAARC